MIAYIKSTLFGKDMTVIKINMSYKQTSFDNEVLTKPGIFNNISMFQVAKFLSSFILILARIGALAIVAYYGLKCFSK